MAHFEQFFSDSLLTYRKVRCGAVLERIAKLHSSTNIPGSGVTV